MGSVLETGRQHATGVRARLVGVQRRLHLDEHILLTSCPLQDEACRLLPRLGAGGGPHGHQGGRWSGRLATRRSSTRTGWSGRQQRRIRKKIRPAPLTYLAKFSTASEGFLASWQLGWRIYQRTANTKSTCA